MTQLTLTRVTSHNCIAHTLTVRNKMSGGWHTTKLLKPSWMTVIELRGASTVYRLRVLQCLQRLHEEEEPPVTYIMSGYRHLSLEGTTGTMMHGGKWPASFKLLPASLLQGAHSSGAIKLSDISRTLCSTPTHVAVTHFVLNFILHVYNFTKHWCSPMLAI